MAMEPEERARAGLFMSFQSPVEVPGVSNIDFLRAASNACRKRRGEAELVRPFPFLCLSQCWIVSCFQFASAFFCLTQVTTPSDSRRTHVTLLIM